MNRDIIHKTLDENTLKDLFQDHFLGLCHFASGFVKDEEAAREIVQDAFVNLWEKRNTIDLSKPVKGYLSTTVRNRCLNYLRDHKKFSKDLLALENLTTDAVYDQADRLVEADIRDQIACAMDELPAKCREVFFLSRYEHLKYQEIADKLEISVKTVETQMSKALQHMRLRLAEYIPVILLLFWNTAFAVYAFLHFTVLFIRVTAYSGV